MTPDHRNDGERALDELVLRQLARSPHGRQAFSSLANYAGVSPENLQRSVRRLVGAVEDCGNTLRITDAGRVVLQEHDARQREAKD